MAWREEAEAGQAAGRVPGVERQPGQDSPALPAGSLRVRERLPGAHDLGMRYCRRAAVPSDIAIPATINQAERHARPAKTQQEISGRKPWIPPVLDGATGSFL